MLPDKVVETKFLMMQTVIVGLGTRWRPPLMFPACCWEAGGSAASKSIITRV